MTKEEKRAYDKARYETNREAVKARSRTWHYANRARANARSRDYRVKHLDRVRECERERRVREADVRRQRARKYHLKRKGKYDPRTLIYAKRARELAKLDGRYQARKLLNRAVASGKIAKPSECQRCHREASGRRLHGHHDDYSKPLEVRWLCSDCHGLIHRKLP